MNSVTLWSCVWCGYALRHYVHLLLSFCVCFHIFLFSLSRARYLNSLFVWFWLHVHAYRRAVEGWKIPGLQEIQVCLNVHRTRRCGFRRNWLKNCIFWRHTVRQSDRIHNSPGTCQGAAKPFRWRSYHNLWCFLDRNVRTRAYLSSNFTSKFSCHSTL